ncbi:UDP-N-acetyl-D-mannosamine dehydrogenase [Candidatus Pseudothioglobus singularis]|nr:UDP-N-acetyl-D-mannosamine dehydrogenase [Candidatus Pseudothioglobus singularis]
MVISVIGLGYIGLPTAAILGSKGFNIIGVDNNRNVVEIINKGKVHIVEPGLEEMVHKAVIKGNLHASSSPKKADIFIIAVPTPFKINHNPDLSYIELAIRNIAPVIQEGNLIILESTVPVGTTEKLKKWLKAERPDLYFPNEEKDIGAEYINIAHCPERVLPGNIINELIENNRIIGGISTKCANRAKNFYKLFVKGDCIITDSRTAELSKLVENSFRDVNIAFANELSLIADKLDIDVWELIQLANLHPRVNILQPGPGVGGHCIAVDPWFIVDSAPEESNLIRQARLVNDKKPEFICKKIKQAAERTKINKSELVIASLGLAFKPNIDDLRGSPAMQIAKNIELMGFKAHYICEPNITLLPDIFNSKQTQLVNFNRALTESDILVLLVDHEEFKQIDLKLIKSKEVIDTRGIWSK